MSSANDSHHDDFDIRRQLSSRASGPQRRRSSWSVLAVGMASLGAGLFACGSSPRSVILITVDTLRADRTPAYSSDDSGGSPIASLAQRGGRFTNALSSAAVTGPAHTSIFTGLYPSFHSISLSNAAYALDTATPTLATIARDQGFATGAVVSSPVLSRTRGLARGFQDYDDRLEGRELARQDHLERYADRATDLAIEWITAHQGQGFLFWLHLQDPHGPYWPRDEQSCRTPLADDGRSLPAGSDESGYRAIPRYQLVGSERRPADYVRRYECEIRFVDEQVGRLLDRVANDRGFERTLVIFTADHGEALGEDDYWFAHGQSAGLELVRVPLIVTGPGIPPGTVLADPVSTTWIFDTVIDHLGLNANTSGYGRSLSTVLRGQVLDLPPVFVETATQSGLAWHGVYLRRDRIPVYGVPPEESASWRPQGTQIVQLTDAAVTDDTRDRLETMLERFDRAALASRERIMRRSQKAEYDPETVRKLQSLGYIN